MLWVVVHLDDWVTDPAVTRAGVESFVADKSKIGHHFLGRYFVCTTSGTTGVPTILVHDAGMLALSPAIELARAIPNWGFALRDWWRFLRLEGRVAMAWPMSTWSEQASLPRVRAAASFATFGPTWCDALDAI